MKMNHRIRDLREDKDLMQQTVASYLMCDQSLYSKYERNERVVPAEVFDRLADFYETSVDYLMRRTDCKEPYPSIKRKG